MKKVMVGETFESGKWLVKFEAAWCAPCKRLSPILDKMESEYPSVNFVAVDIDVSAELKEKYSIRSVPTVVFIDEGKEVKRIAGLAAPAMYTSALTLLKG